MMKKILWVADMLLSIVGLYWVGWCVGDHIGSKIPEVFGLEEE